jgi:hypothetical protein
MQFLSWIQMSKKEATFGRARTERRSGTFALDTGVVVVVVVVVPVAAGLREHGEQGECEEQHLGSHVCSSLQLQELVLVATGVSPLLFSSAPLPFVLWLDWISCCCCLSICTRLIEAFFIEGEGNPGRGPPPRGQATTPPAPCAMPAARPLISEQVAIDKQET